MKPQLTPQDIMSVANSIGITSLPSETIGIILAEYPYEQKLDPTATWDLVVENLIYQNQDK